MKSIREMINLMEASESDMQTAGTVGRDQADADFDAAQPQVTEEEVEVDIEEAYDMQNGYNDVEVADGDDYFPNGADGPVVSKVGPSGARQGDNPEQKRMQVAEVHKELVYGYRNFLKESSKK